MASLPVWGWIASIEEMVTRYALQHFENYYEEVLDPREQIRRWLQVYLSFSRSVLASPLLVRLGARRSGSAAQSLRAEFGRVPDGRIMGPHRVQELAEGPAVAPSLLRRRTPLLTMVLEYMHTYMHTDTTAMQLCVCPFAS